MPIVHSTINVATGRGQPTVPELAELLEDNPPIDRTTTNAWEDAEFLAAVRATGRRKLILCALWTRDLHGLPRPRRVEGGLRRLSSRRRDRRHQRGRPSHRHRSASSRPERSPITWVALAVELQRDWAREETVADVIEIVLTERLLQHERGDSTASGPRSPIARLASSSGRRIRCSRALIDARPGFRPRAWMDELPPLDAFGTLIFQVAGQQLSGRGDTARSCLGIEERFGGHLPTPAELLAADPQVLRAARALSAQGRDAARARGAVRRRTPERRGASLAMTDDEVEAALTEVPGIGPWTARGFLLVALDRPDVFLTGDLALRRAIQRLYDFDHRPHRMSEIARCRSAGGRTAASPSATYSPPSTTEVEA